MTAENEFRFRKPPVAEVWISVDFDPNENKREWELELVQRYIEQYEEELPKLQAIHEQQIQVEEVSPQTLPRVTSRQIRLQFVRMSDNEQSHSLKIGDDQLSFHIMKAGGVHPRYHAVRSEMQKKLDDYTQIFQPTRIRNATLHYLDIIDIPRANNGIMQLQDYFRVSIDLPEEPFGLTVGFAHQFQVMCPTDPGPLFLQLKAVPSPRESDVFRFRMEWHKQSADVNSLDSSEMWARMDVAHEYMRECFRASLTERTLELFEPIAED